MATTIDVYNSALSAIGAKSNYTSDVDPSVEIQTCARWFDPVRKLVLSAAPWTSTMRVAKLVVAKERDTAADWVSTDPPPGYLFSYTAPDEMIQPLWMSDYSPFTVTQSSTGATRINSNVEDAIFYYTKEETDPDDWDAPLNMAINFALAAHIAMKLTGKKWIVEDMQRQANGYIMNARLVNANSVDNALPETVAPWHAARGVVSVDAPRFIYPYGPNVNVAWF